MFLESNPICSPGATMIPRNAFIEAGMFDERLRAQVDDYDLYLRVQKVSSCPARFLRTGLSSTFR